MHAGAADILGGDKPLFQRRQNMQIGVAAVHVAAGFQSQRSGFRRGSGYAVGSMEIPYRPAVRGEIAVKAPLPQLVHQELAGARRLAVHKVVSAHDALDVSLLHQRLKRREIGLLQILLGNHRVKGVAFRLRAAVYREMLCAGGGFEVLSVPLKPLDVLHPQPRSE